MKETLILPTSDAVLVKFNSLIEVFLFENEIIQYFPLNRLFDSTGLLNMLLFF